MLYLLISWHHLLPCYHQPYLSSANKLDSPVNESYYICKVELLYYSVPDQASERWCVVETDVVLMMKGLLGTEYHQLDEWATDQLMGLVATSLSALTTALT